ncbi:MAG: isocitrate lyase/phosphoenolpyruvate mutase family protein [Cytophagaceae bacterium]|nr:isocitrate lyase/phosphoenolpyruvate mutase family protein [Gemmatimonadaceae bacterium]
MTNRDRTRTFHEMHQSGCFMIPNPWDVGSARLLESMGFTALATTSSGHAWSLGRPDNHVTLDEALAHFAAISSAVSVPVNGDFEGAFAETPEDVAVNMARAAATGVAGLSIEDSTGDGNSPLFGFDLAVERVAAARAGIDDAGTGVVLTARTEGFIVGRPDLDETLRRLVAFAAAGADCLYAPGIKTPAEIRAVVEAVAPRAVNVLVGGDFTTREALAALGVRRISVGGALARAAWGGFLAAATEIATEGTFGGLARATPFAHLESAFARHA